MTTSLRSIAASSWFVLTMTVLVSVTTLFVGRAAGLTRTDWPGWVQAVGSVVAILVAVWVSWQQSERQREREKAQDEAEIRGILRSIRAELESTLEFAREHIGGHLSEAERGAPILHVFPIAEDSFPIYAAFTPQLGKVTPDSRREELVATFASARSFVLTVRYHNQMVEAFDQAVGAARKRSSADDEDDIAHLLTSLARYSDSLRSSFTEAMTKGEKLLQDLRMV